MTELADIVFVDLQPIGEKLDRIAGDMHAVRVRMTDVEGQLAKVGPSIAGVACSIDRLAERLDRVRPRLDLAEAHT